MLSELHVENVGVIADLSLVFGPGMTVFTGETGAGKTLVVEAIVLLLGARADAALVRAGSSEARVEARFEGGPSLTDALDAVEALDPGDGEIVLTRVVPAQGRSRAYINGRLVPAGVLVEVGRHLVDLHGQHSHHALLTPAAQRAALDQYGKGAASSALEAYGAARRRVVSLDAELADLGGDERERAREVDLLRFQVDEIDAASLSDLDEDDRLAEEERALLSARDVKESALAAYAALETEAVQALGTAAAAIKHMPRLDAAEERARVLQDEVGALARDLRHVAEQTEEDPARLDAVVVRRRLLSDLRRKYGETLGDVLAYRSEAAMRLHALLEADERARTLGLERDEARRETMLAAQKLSELRRSLAPELAGAIAAELADLRMASAALEIDVQPSDDVADFPADGLDDVEFRLAANPGEPAQPLSRVASGGELARTMLAARVVLTDGPPTFVFDEVDAGIGGQAGVAVGRRLAIVARRHQVLCVTHLAQVAAFADAHVVVEKAEEGARTVARATAVDGADRVAELSRMLSGHGTQKARRHAEELLTGAAKERAR